ncbi:MAG: hypothetical protein JNL50_04460 [Phycisphaerae bacterium]|nr:hypothetical protein [Phycisphaerae bacterium]
MNTKISARRTALAIILASTFAACASAQTCRQVVVASNTSDNLLAFNPDGSFDHQFSGAMAGNCYMTYGPDGHIYVSDTATDAVYRFNGRTFAPMGAFVAPASAGLNDPQGLCFGPDGNLYVTSAGANTPKVLRFNGATGAFISYFVAVGAPMPGGITFGPDGNLYYVCNTCQDVIRYDGQTGAFIDLFVKSQQTDSPKRPRGLCFGPDGHLYVTCASIDDCVRRYDGQTGTFIDFFAIGGLNDPLDLAFTPWGTLLVSGSLTDNVQEFDAVTGSLIGTFASPGEGGTGAPSGLLVLRAPADFNADGFVNADDYDAFAEAFDAADLAADFNADGFVNGDDYDAFAEHFEAGC